MDRGLSCRLTGTVLVACHLDLHRKQGETRRLAAHPMCAGKQRQRGGCRVAGERAADRGGTLHRIRNTTQKAGAGGGTRNTETRGPEHGTSGAAETCCVPLRNHVEKHILDSSHRVLRFIHWIGDLAVQQTPVSALDDDVTSYAVR
eukprot:1321601-Prymnesium_polylepis.1